MKQVDVPSGVVHVLVCCNARGPGGMPSCADRGTEVYSALRGWVTRHGLLSRVWVTRTSCLGWCHAEGATLVLYPAGEILQGVTLGDIEQVIDRIEGLRRTAA